MLVSLSVSRGPRQPEGRTAGGGRRGWPWGERGSPESPWSSKIVAGGRSPPLYGAANASRRIRCGVAGPTHSVVFVFAFHFATPCGVVQSPVGSGCASPGEV